MTTTTAPTVCQSFAVEGMTCHHCVVAVTTELSRLDGVSKVDVDLPTGIVRTESHAPLGRDAVAAAIDEAGYELVGR